MLPGAVPLPSALTALALATDAELAAAGFAASTASGVPPLPCHHYRPQPTHGEPTHG